MILGCKNAAACQQTMHAPRVGDPLWKLASVVVLITLVLSTGLIADAQSESVLCRGRAASVHHAVQNCRDELARGEVSSCTVTVGPANTNLSIDQAETLANEFDQRAYVLRGLEDAVSDRRGRVERDQQAVRTLGFEKNVQEIEDWESLSEEAKVQFDEEARDDVLSSFLDTAQVSTDWIKSLNPPKANKIISELHSAGIDSPSFNAALRRVAATAGKPKIAKDVKDLLDSFKRLKDIAAMQPLGTANSRLEALGTALGWLLNDPRLDLLVSDVRFATSSVYNNFARRVSQGQVAQITKLTEQELQDLKRIHGMLVSDVASLKSAQDQLAGAAGCPWP